MPSRDLTYNLIGKDVSASAVMSNTAASAEKMASRIGASTSSIASKIGGELGSALNSASEIFNKFAESGANAGTKLLAVGGGVTALGLELNHLASGEQQAQQELDAAIVATGGSFSDYKDEIEKVISKSEDFGHSSKDAQNALAKLTEATNDPAKAIEKMGLVEDIAAAKHESLTDASNQLALGLSGSGRVLKQFGITLDTTLPKQEAVNKAIGELQQKLSGQAAAAADTFDGKIKAVKEHLTEWVAVMGEKLGPVLTVAGPALMVLGGAMDVYKAKTAVSAVANVGLAASSTAATASEAKQTITTVTLAESLQALRMAQINAAVANEALAASSGEAAVAQDAQAVSSKGSMVAGLGATTGVLGFAVAAGYAGFQINKFLESNNAGAKAMGDLNKNMTSLTQAFQADGNAIGDQTKQVAQSALQSEGLAGKAAKAGISLGQLTTGVTGTNDQFKKLVDTWKASGKPSDDTIAALALLYDEAHNLKGATADLTDSTQAETSAMSSQIDMSNQLSDALNKLSNKNISAAQAQDTFLDGLDKFTQDVKDNGAALNQNTTAGRANYEAVLSSIKAANDHAEAVYKQTGSLADATDALNTDESALRDAAAAAGFNKDQIDAMIQKYAAVPDKVSTTVELNAGGAFATIAALDDRVRNLSSDASSVSFGGRGVFGTQANASGGMIGAASGAVFPIRSINGTRVDEYGSELLDMGTGRVYPTGESQRMKNHVGGGTTVVNNITIKLDSHGVPTVDDGRRIAAALAPYLNAGGRLN